LPISGAESVIKHICLKSEFDTKKQLSGEFPMRDMTGKPAELIRSKRMFFILSTGRSGTQTIAKTLSGIDGCICKHEPSPELIIESSKFRYGLMNSNEIKNILLKSRKPLLNGCTYGESNQTLALLIPVLSNVFPKSRYIWLIRNGLDFVASTYSRQWYTGHSANHKHYENCPQLEKDWIDGRVRGDLCGDVPEERWRQMTPFAKCCWYWGYINRLIEQDLKTHSSETNCRMARLEDIDAEIGELISWLGFKPASNILVGQHNKAHYEIYNHHCWTDAEMDTFVYWCGPMMDRLYPEWRKNLSDKKNFGLIQDKTLHSEQKDDSECFEGNTHETFLKCNATIRNQIHFTPQKPIIPKISIYITSYNQKKYLVEAIESVLCQTLKPSQIIVVDDGSTDGSQNLIRSYARKFPSLFVPVFHEKNCGVAASRINALHKITGDYVSYLDGDDRYLPTKLEKEFCALVEQNNAYIAYSNNYYVSSSGNRFGTWIDNETPPQGYVFPQTFGRMFPKRSLFRMELVNYQAWKAVGFHDPSLSLYEDFDMRIRLTKYFHAVYVDEPLSEIRMHGKGLSSLKTSKHLASLEYLYRKNIPLLMDLSAEQRKFVKANFDTWVAGIAAKNMKSPKSKKSKSSASKNSNSLRKTYKKVGRQGKGLIFLISQPRSGSTLLQRILNTHPDVHTTAEPWLMLHPLFGLKENGIKADYDASLYRTAVLEFLNNAPEGEELYYDGLREMALRIYRRMLTLSGKSYFLDKTPRYYQVIPELYRLFPEAYYIILLRNPLGVLSSVLETWFMNKIERVNPPIYKDLLQGPALLLRGIRLLKENAIVVDYESLVKEPERVIQNLCRRLDLPFQSNMLEYGRIQLQGGSFGDPKNIFLHHRPVEDYVEKWIDNLRDNGLSEFAARYLSYLGKELLDGLGYSYRDIKALLYTDLRPKTQTKIKRINSLSTKSLNSDDYLITAIVSTYNSEKFIRGCLQDLVDQTIAHRVEIIVVNSGSHQNEETIIREFQKKYENIKYIRTEQCETVYAAWNRAIKSASGKYITNANTDDRHRKDAFEIMAKILEESPELALVYANVMITETENETFENCNPIGIYRWLDWDRDKLLFKGCFMGPQPMWRREVHEEYGYFDENLVTSGDYEFWLRISQTRNFFHIPETLGLYLKSQTSIEHRNREIQQEENRKILEEYRNSFYHNKIIKQVNPYITQGRILSTHKSTTNTENGFDGDSFCEARLKLEKLINKDSKREAIEECKKLLKDFPKFAQGYNDLGVLYYAVGEKDSALQCYQKAVELCQDNPIYKKNLADLLSIEIGNLEAALQLYVEVLKSSPNDLEVLVALATICMRLERKDDAEYFWNRVLESDPGNAQALAKLRLLSAKTDTAYSSAAVKNEYEILKNEIAGSRTENIIRSLKIFQDANPNFGDVNNDLGVLYHLQGKMTDALKHFRRAAELEPQNKEFSKNLGDFLFSEMKQTQSAIDIYQRIVQQHFDDLPSLMMLGHLCSCLKRYDEAERYYARVLEIAPDHPEASKFFAALKEISQAQGDADPLTQTTNDPDNHESSSKVEFLTQQYCGARETHSHALTSIVLLLAGSQDRIKRCLSNIENNTELPYEFLLVDCGSDHGTEKFLRQLCSRHAHVQVIKSDQETVLPVALNQACKKAEGKYIVILNSDVVVGKGWLDGLIECADLQENVGIVGPMSNHVNGHQKAFGSGNLTKSSVEAFAREYGRTFKHRRIATEEILGHCHIFHSTLIRQIGFFDTNYHSEIYTVKDFCKRASLMGFQNLVAGGVYVHQDGKHNGHSFYFSDHCLEDRVVYTAKWEGFETEGPVVKALTSARIYQQGMLKFQQGHITSAVENFLQGIAHDSEAPKFYIGLAGQLKNNQQYQAAIETLQEMPKSYNYNDLHKKTMHSLRGFCELGLDHRDRAETWVNSALEIDPNYAPALNLKGMLAYKGGNSDQAVEFFRRSIESDPGYGEAYTNLGVVYWDRDEKETAFEWLKRGFILDPLELDISNLFQTAVAELGKFEAVETVVRDTASIYSTSKRLQSMAADILINLGKYSDAIAKVEKMISQFGFDDDILKMALTIRETLGPMKIGKRLKHRPTVSLCMIVKNEEQHLARCLYSVKPIVDEMIVVDTGSTDRTREIASIFGARVIDYQWDDDFAAARNTSLSDASGDWILVMDADEVISEQDHEAFRQLFSKKRKAPCAYSVVTRNYNSEINVVGWVPNSGEYPVEEAGTGWLASTKVRLFPRAERIRFEGAVHEMVESALERFQIPTKPCAIPVHHYGRLDKGSLDRKGILYYEIGRKKLESMGDDPRALRELAVQATILNKNEEALTLWSRLLNLDINAAGRAYAHVNMGTIYSRMGRFDDALEMAELAMEEQPNMKEAHYNLAMAKLHLGFAEQTIKILENLLRRFPDYPPAQFVLTAAYGCCERPDDFKVTVDQLKRSSFGNALVTSFIDLAKGLIRANMTQYARDILKNASRSGLSTPEMVDLQASLMNHSQMSKFGMQHSDASSSMLNSGV
jgi:glycosyltransferase involved in cell wall biosynthesis/Tfp pilus assembly protein PilF